MTQGLRRRAWLGLAAAAMAGCALAPRAGQAVAVAPGVYVVQGTGGAADEHNLGRIGNAGFIVGDHGVIVVDTGTSYAHGQALLAAIREVTDQPVRLAIVTHTQPDFLFGGTAFQERGVPVRMNTRTALLMASRCETCLRTLRTLVGDEPMRGTAMYKPDQQFDGTHDLDLIGRRVRVLFFGHSSGPGDVAVFDATSGVLFAGGLLDAHRIPDIQDSDLKGWRSALREIRALQAKLVVPGHGPAGAPPPILDATEDYLAQLEARMRGIVASGASLLGAADAAELPAFESWDQYETIHRRNASVAYLRIERELMFK